MSEEVKLDGLVEQPVEVVDELVESGVVESNEPVESVSELSESEQTAKDQGWKPPSEFSDGDKEPLSADEFLRRGELFDKIKDLKHQNRRENQQLQKQVEELTGMMKKERDKGYTQALSDLESKRQEAIEIGDVDAFNSVDSEYIRLREELSNEKAANAARESQVDDIPAEAIKFQESNADWFNSNTQENNDMVTQAINIDQHLSESKPYLSTTQRLESVEKEIKALYPHRFSNSKKRQPSKVESSAVVGDPGKADQPEVSIKYSDLDDRQKDACARFMALGDGLTAEDYLKSVEEGLRIRNQL